MKNLNFDAGWALVFGLLVAPFLCALNGLVVDWRVDGFNYWLWEDFRSACFATPYFTVPLGFMTTRVLIIWRQGKVHQARWHAVGFGLLALGFWWWLWLVLAAKGHPFAFPLHPPHYPIKNVYLAWWPPGLTAPLALPFLWSLCFLLFAFFARPPRS